MINGPTLKIIKINKTDSREGSELLRELGMWYKEDLLVLWGENKIWLIKLKEKVIREDSRFLSEVY